MNVNLSIFNNILYGKYGPRGIYVCLDKLRGITTSKLRTGAFQIKSFSHGKGSILEHNGIIVWFIELSNGDILFSVNPSLYDSYGSLISFLREIFIDDDFINTRINHLDCTITFPVDFYELFVGMDFGRTRVLESYMDTPKQKGFYFGRHQRKYSGLIYDKQKEAELLYPCTRIEINSKPKIEKDTTTFQTLTGQTYFSLANLNLVCEHEPFKSIRLCNIEFIEPINCSQAIRDRFIEFRTRCLREGFWWTRRCLNIETNKNFSALYGNFYNRTPLNCPTLDEMFQQGIRQFFN